MERNLAGNPSDFVTRPALYVIDGGLAHRPQTPEQWLESGFRELCARCKRQTNAKGYATPAVAATAQGIRFPLRVIARLIAGVLMAGGPVEFGEQLGHLLICYNAQKAARLNRTPPRDDHRVNLGEAA